MDILSNLKYAPGSKKKRKRVGRGEGSGHGGTATRGMNGQLSRSGSKHRAWFEGGQMPLQRRIPKHGFTNINKKYYQLVNVSDLERIAGKVEDAVLNIEQMRKFGIISSTKKLVKLLGNGNIKSKLQVEAHAFSKSAQEKIEAAGGSITQI
jgi:large subunit ribosomal protein L15